MKIAITWYDEDKDARINGMYEFDESFIWKDEIQSKIEIIVNSYEDKGITIDQGGDDLFYEFGLPDFEETEEWLTTAKQLLKDIEGVLTL